MVRGIVIIIWSFGVLGWPQVGLGQGTIYTWVDSKGGVHYSDAPTVEARLIDDALPPAASFGTPPDSTSPAETPLPALPAQGITADVVADATEREEMSNQGEGGTEGGHQVGRDEEFTLGRDGPFGPDSNNAFED